MRGHRWTKGKTQKMKKATGTMCMGDGGQKAKTLSDGICAFASPHTPFCAKRARTALFAFCMCMLTAKRQKRKKATVVYEKNI